MRGFLLITAFALFGCGSTPEPVVKSEPPPAPVKDLSGMLPLTGRVSARVVPDHLLDQPKMPGGTIGDYDAGGKKYQLFLIETDTNQKAAFLLVDMKSALQNPEYLAHMGGYFGSDGTRQIYVFAKLQYLAGVVGLSRDDADPIARVLAARLK